MSTVCNFMQLFVISIITALKENNIYRNTYCVSRMSIKNFCKKYVNNIIVINNVCKTNLDSRVVFCILKSRVFIYKLRVFSFNIFIAVNTENV